LVRVRPHFYFLAASSTLPDTMYLIDQGWWFVPNPLNKFTVSLRDNPKFNADGSLTLYFQNESPGADKEANWLPAPNASARVYEYPA
jgi:hypothetical protein